MGFESFFCIVATVLTITERNERAVKTRPEYILCIKYRHNLFTKQAVHRLLIVQIVHLPFKDNIN